MEVIRQDILLGKLTPGQKLVVADLKEHYQVGASPIREALVQLSWKKYVKFAPQKGCWVAPVSVEELTDLFNAHHLISHELLKKAILQGDEAWELNILTSYHKLSRLNPTADNADLSEWEQRHGDFHIAILSGSNSPVLLDLYLDIYEQLKRYRHIWLSQSRDSENRYHDSGEHEALMKAVLDRDIELAQKMMNEHSKNAVSSVSPYL
ncbi:FCD domain-containing protein [Photobacterium carnosum]|uniref:FCD domain-containing protein n=1 Tax=Photobacterium carnosum TaxID=2023717 RepID=UPI001E6394F7|nr:FCD domain-containing protein [Photobacterium carnosum]MCD9515196.1 FCD domain-containing protein [Photobacterium carnosum]